MLDSVVVLLVVGLVALVAWQEKRLLTIRNAVAADVQEFAELGRKARGDFLANLETARTSALATERLYTEALTALTAASEDLRRREQTLLTLHEAEAAATRRLEAERKRLDAAAAEFQAIGKRVTARGEEIAATVGKWQGEAKEAAAKFRVMSDAAIAQLVVILRAAGVDVDPETGEAPRA